MVSGLQLACQLRAKDLIVHINSQLVTEQINDEYNVKEEALKRYHTMVTQLLTGFDEVEIKQLPRNDNTCADALSKLASSIIIEQRGKILLESKEAPSNDSPQIPYIV